MDDFIKQFNWSENEEIISHQLNNILRKDKSIFIPSLSIDSEDNDYYISIKIGFKPSDDDYNFVNLTSYHCHMSESSFYSYLPLYTSQDMDAGYFGPHTLSKIIITDEEKKDWSNVNDMVNFLVKNISIDISKLKDKFGYKECKELCEPVIY